MNIRVSVIVPSKDPGSCIRKCIGSLQKQTLKNIEIICVDAGSADGTAQFLNEVSMSDQRVSAVTLRGASFGELVNAGLSHARGIYVAVIRPSDTLDPEMLHELYSVSSGMDMVMGGFHLTPAKGEEETLYKLPPRYTAIKSFDPLLTFDTALDQSEIFSINCAVGSAIFLKDLLDKNSIWFSETDNSLYHDTSFSFKVWSCASHVRLLDSAMLHCGFRGGFVKGGGAASVYPVFEEYEEIGYFIRERFAEDPKRIKVLSGIMMRLKYDSYMSCCHVLSGTDMADFVRVASEEFQKDAGRGLPQQKYFPSFDWNVFSTWVYDPESVIDMIERSRKPSLLSRILKRKK